MGMKRLSTNFLPLLSQVPQVLEGYSPYPSILPFSITWDSLLQNILEVTEAEGFVFYYVTGNEV